MGDLSRIRVTGPLEPYVSGFVAELDRARIYAGVGRASVAADGAREPLAGFGGAGAG